MRRVCRTFAPVWLLCLVLVGAAPSVATASPVFDGTNADLWLIDEETGRITGYDFNAWLDQFAPSGTPLYPLAGGEQALINLLQNSSVPMSPNQPAISIVGIDPGLDGGNPSGHPSLLVMPGSGTYDMTIAVQLMVNTQVFSRDPAQLFWTVDGGEQQSATLTNSLLSAPGTVEQGGYYVQTIYIARDGAHVVDVELFATPGTPPFTPRQVAAETRNYSLVSSHEDGEARDSDGDGIPDVVEAELGLDPYDDDWQKDSDGDGWSDFDEWLRTLCLDGSLQPRPGTDCTDADGNPQDTDGDGWADFDELVRGTNDRDRQFAAGLLIEGNETVTSASLLERVRSYKDFPAARRLYEVERVAAGVLPTPASEPLPAGTVSVVSILGVLSYASDELLTVEDLDRVLLSDTDVPLRMQAAHAVDELANARVPSMRLPAGSGSVLNATYRSATAGDTYRRIYKKWLTQRTDLSPKQFALQTGPQEYIDADAWRSAFVAYLVANAVIQEPGLIVDLSATSVVSMLEAALSRESRLNGLQETQLLTRNLGALDPNLVQTTRDGLERIAGESYTFDHVIAAYENASQPGQMLEPVAQWIATMFIAGVDGTRTDAFIASRFKADGTNDYLVRLMQLPGAFAAITADASLGDRLTDSDADGAGNAAELDVPLTAVTLPWVADSDGDSILDGIDECPIDPFNACSANPILPVITVGFDVVVAEPAAGSNFAIVSVILNRIVDFDVTIDYTASVSAGDTAELGVDFIEISGTVTIPAGERVALISVPVLADSDAETPETFTVQITGVTGATIGDDGIAVVTINNTDPGANSAPVFTSATSISVVVNGVATGYTATADDADGDVLTFGLSGGADQTQFTIDAVTGVLRFVQVPDFNAPADADANNDYEVQLIVDDNRGASDTLDVVVTVVEQTLQIQMTYPTPNANLGGGVTTTRVRGNIVDPAGNPIDLADIVALDVNLNAATLDPVNVGRWSADVPVSEGLNTLDIALELTDGTVVSVTHELQNSGVYFGLADSEPDFANNRVFVVSGSIGGVLSVDLATGERSVISAVGLVGAGATFSSPRGVVLDSANNRLLVVDWQRDALIAVSLANGDRTEISRGSIGTGFALDGPNAIAFDAANNRVYVPTTIDDVIVAIDLATGDRTNISGQGVGAGPDFGGAQGIVFDASSDRLYVSDTNLDGIMAVDIASGDRTVLSDGVVGTGTQLSSPLDMDLDIASNRLLVADQSRGLIAVDLTTGDRTVVTNPIVEYGPNGSDVQSVVIDTVNNTAYVPDSRLDVIFAVDLSDGTRTILSDNSVGSGSVETSMFIIRGLGIDRSRDRLLLLNWSTTTLFDVNLANADRSVVSNGLIGSGPLPTFPGRFDIDETNDRVLFTDQNLNALVAVDLGTGDRTILSSNTGVGLGPLFSSPSDTKIDAANDRAFVLDSAAGLLEVDLITGDRTVVSDAATGSGPTFGFADGLDIDFATNTGYVVDDGGTAVYQVDIVTGDRVILSDNAGAGVGPAISVPHDLQLDVTNNRALIVNRAGVQSLMAIDLSSGDRTIVSGVGIGGGIELVGPYFIALDLLNARTFVFTIGLNGVIVIDLATGDRALTSK